MKVTFTQRTRCVTFVVLFAASAFHGVPPMVTRGDEPDQSQKQRNRAVRIAELIGIVQDEDLAKTDRPKVVNAILELGELKAVEAAPVLAEKLDFHRSATGRYKIYLGPEHAHPALKALGQIGKPALEPVLEAVSSRDRSETFQIVSRWAVLRICGGLEETEAAIEDYRKRCLNVAREYEQRARRVALISEAQGEDVAK